MNHPVEALTMADGAWKVWQDADTQEWFRQVIGIYTDSTHSSSDTSIQLAKAQIALEVLAWVTLLEEKVVPLTKRIDDLHASLRIRLMLSYCDIPLAIPASLAALSNAVSGVIGPEAVTMIRNLTTHPTKEHLAELRRYDAAVPFQSWLLSLWYVEMVMLHLLGYKGPHENRLDLGGMVGGRESVPWIKKV